MFDVASINLFSTETKIVVGFNEFEIFLQMRETVKTPESQSLKHRKIQ